MPRRILMRAVVVVATLATSLVVTVEGAHAAAGINGSLAAPTPVFVGQSGLPASLTAINTNSPPQQTETNTWTTIRVAPTCAAAPAAPNPCPSPELGVFALSATGSGATGTACAGMTFNISAPDASGIVTFAPVGTVVLQPPGGPVGSDRCTINYTFSVLKLPNVDTNLGTGGTQTRMNARMQVTSSPTGLQPAANPSLEITVVPGSPDISTQVSSSSVFLGGTVTDTATVTVGPVGPPVTGTVTFNLYGPNDPTCSGISIFTSANRPLTSGVATSSPYTPTAVGTYRFVAVYSGDANYSAVSGLCNEAGETFVVTVARKPAADFDGDGDTDVSVFRPSNATWFTLGGSPASVVWGAVGDVPVPADYDGDGNVDEAVFRPSNNTWFLRTNAPQSIVWGAAGDIPVPADYDGNGTADLAVFRPSNGTWFIRTAAPAVDRVGRQRRRPRPRRLRRQREHRPRRLPAGHQHLVPANPRAAVGSCGAPPATSPSPATTTATAPPTSPSSGRERYLVPPHPRPAGHRLGRQRRHPRPRRTTTSTPPPTWPSSGRPPTSGT